MNYLKKILYILFLNFSLQAIDFDYLDQNDINSLYFILNNNQTVLEKIKKFKGPKQITSETNTLYNFFKTHEKTLEKYVEKPVYTIIKPLFTDISIISKLYGHKNKNKKFDLANENQKNLEIIDTNIKNLTLYYQERKKLDELSANALEQERNTIKEKLEKYATKLKDIGIKPHDILFTDSKLNDIKFKKEIEKLENQKEEIEAKIQDEKVDEVIVEINHIYNQTINLIKAIEYRNKNLKAETGKANYFKRFETLIKNNKLATVISTATLLALTAALLNKKSRDFIFSKFSKKS